MPDVGTGAGVATRRGSGRSTSRTGWPDRLDRAVSGDGVRLAFQPIVDLSRRMVVGYEALARFDAVDGVERGPDEWFQAAERVGVGAELDATVLALAMDARRTLPANCFLSVNVDPESLLDPRLTSLLMAERSLGGLVIEITEHRPWDWTLLSPVVDRLRASGALFAVDDAGAGYSGLRQVLQLRPSILKLDRSLVKGIDTDEAKSSLVEMLGLFANRVDAWVLAEGVETIGEARKLSELQVPLSQGFYLGRPAAPWTELDPMAARALAGHARTSSDTLHRYLDPVATARQDVEPVASWLDGDDSWVAVVDADGRPVGLLDGTSALSGELLPTLVANVHSSPVEVANRLATSSGEPSAPVIVTDNGGRYLGLLTVRRLLATLAKRADGRPLEPGA